MTVQTTLPQGIEVSLLSVERPGTYVDRVRTDTAGILQFIGIKPGTYKLVFQFSAPDVNPSNPAYNYGESDPFEVKPGANRFDWTAGQSEVVRKD